MNFKSSPKNAFLLALALSAEVGMAAETGRVGFETGLGAGVTTFQAGQKVYLGLKDVDRNLDAAVVDRVSVLVTSGTEDTGTRAKAEEIKAGANQGNGALAVLKTGYDTKTETWTVTCLGVTPPEFKVVGSVSGEQSRRYKIDQGFFETDKGQVRFEITQGALGFGVLDSFSFKTVAGTLVGETISLVETGINTGIFRAEVPLDAVGAAAQDSKLQVRSGEYLRVFYDDPKGDFGGAEQVRGSALYSQTVLGGVTILGNTVWEKAGSPYLITGDVTVKEGVTLTVQAGVKVIFLTDSDSTVGGDTPYDSELRVNGILSVVGTEAEPVLFTSSEETKRAGQWGGIYAATAKLNYAVVEGMMYGVKGQTVEVNNSIVRMSGGEGIRADGGSLVVKKSRIEKCSGWAIVVASCGFDIALSQIVENGGGFGLKALLMEILMV